MKDINERIAAELSESVVPHGEFNDVIAQIANNIKADFENPAATDEAEYEKWKNADPVDIPMDLEEAEDSGDEGLVSEVKSFLAKRAAKALIQATKATKQ